MPKTNRRIARNVGATLSVAALSLIMAFGWPMSSRADEADARRLLKAMSEYMTSQTSISFEYDATLEVVTPEDQKLALANSGAVTLLRPNMIRASRSGGFADIEMVFDGKMLTALGKQAGVYTQIEIPGSIDHLLGELQDEHHLPMPAADLLLTNSYDELMRDVVDVKDLGSGVIGGVECDSLAFRTDEVDFQIWIAHGDHPYPCRYVITSKKVVNAPQYSIQTRNWKTGADVAAADFTFTAPAGAKKIELEQIRHMMSGFPEHFAVGDAK